MDKKQKATEEQKSLKKTSQENGLTKWNFPTTKRKALDLQDLGAKTSISQALYGNLVQFFMSIGADNELPEDKSKRISYINEFHNKVAVNNPLFPEDLPFGFVYGAFVNAVMYDRVELKGHNIHAFISAFKRWITQMGVEDNLRESYYRENPEARPNKKEPESTKLEDWPDQWIKEQYETICMIFKDHNGKIPIFQTSGAKSYFNRIKSEYGKRFDKDPAELLYG